MPIPKRKPVANGGAAARGRSPSPASGREGISNAVPIPKPVPGTNPASGSHSPRSQSPNVQIISRTNGKFDPATITNAPSGYTPPASPVQASSRPASPSPSRPQVKRTDSHGSTGSWRVRRDSFSRMARRMSDTFKDFKDSFHIVTMDKNERMGYVRNKHEEENKRRQDSPIRPDFPSDSAVDLGRLSYGPSERSSQLSSKRSSETGLPSKPKPGNLTKGETFAIGVSKVVDPLKLRGRSGTEDSDMSFGMTDSAPLDAMCECSGCSRPTHEYLINGLCKDCHALVAKVAKKAKSQGK